MKNQTSNGKPAETALAPITPPTPIETGSTAIALVPQSLEGAYQLAGWIAKSQLIAGTYKDKPHDVFTVLITGAELGLPPMAALRGLYVVNGKPALEAKTKMAICLQRGAALYFKKIEDTDAAVTWETCRRGSSEPVKSRFTIKDAQHAGLVGEAGKGGGKPGPWQQYPRRMMSWRALGFLCDDVYADVVLGVASAEDFEPSEYDFKPIGVGVELGTPPANVQLEASPANPKPATSPPVVRDDPKAEVGSFAKDPHAKPQMTDDEAAEVLALIKTTKTRADLKKLTEERITSRTRTPEQHDRLLKAWEEQDELITIALRDEGGES